MFIKEKPTLYLYDVLYVFDIHQNLFFILVMLKLGFFFCLENNYVEMYLKIIFYGCGYFMGDFLVLDVKYSGFLGEIGRGITRAFRRGNACWWRSGNDALTTYFFLLSLFSLVSSRFMLV
jgi:hypothetical protein